MFDLSADIIYPENPDSSKVQECEEFRQMITTCRLVIELHQDKPNTAVRKACRRMLETFKGTRSRKVLKVVIESPLPSAYIKSLERHLNEDAKAKVDKNEI